MTVSSSTNRASYSGNGTLTTFAYGFKVFDQDDLTVILRASNGTETVQTITTDYTVTGVGDVGGGNVVFGTAPASGVTVVILREMDLEQGLDLVPNDPFPAQSLENSLDKLTFMVQQHDEQLGRAIKASRTNVLSGSEFVISAADRANKVFSFDGSGDLAVTQELGTFQGNWATATVYQVRDIVKDTSTNNIFIVNTEHTSSGAQPLTTNANSAKYDLIVDAASATTSATNAAASETAAQTAQTASEAAQAASEAAQSAAETAETNAETAETNSETAQAAAEAAQAAAELVYDNFDDRYLGAKSTAGGDPTLDNDGDALIDGALFFDTTNNVMKFYNLGTTTWLRTTPTTADQTNINTVSGIQANVTTVAGISTDVTTVSGISSNVTSVAGIYPDVTTVAGISANVTTVAGISGNVTTVAGISANVTAVAGDEADIGTVATNISNVNTVAGISGNVTTVAGISADVTSVAGDATDIGTVATNIADVNTVAGISADVTTVAADGTDIGTVASISGNVTTVAGANSNVTTVATNIASVNTAASNITDIQNASANAATATTQAGIATTKASEAAASASAASTSEANADTSEANALTYSSNAATSAAAAASSAAGIAGYDLDVIAETKGVTAVDVFVYDTSRDTDGGSWRKRTQGTSWYNETLNTSTRGSRREFPAVAVIVAESDTVTIYDGDDPSLPMWMVFNRASGNPLYSEVTSVSALNGHIVVGQNTGNGGLTEIKFINDRAYLRINDTNEYNGEIIADRNDGGGVTISGTVPNAIVNRLVNDVAMTVLPNAPIDAATGLPVPTIAVATDGGVSVIKDDGNVFDLTYLLGGVDSELVEFDGKGGIYWGGYSPFSNASIYLYWNKTLPTADDNSTPDTIYASNENAVADLITKKGNFGYNSLSISEIIAAGASNGLFLIDQKDDSLADGMTLQMTSSFNTGWMNGDVKGAFLSDTDDTDLVGTELVTNGTFDSDISGWTDLVNATWDAGEINCADGRFFQEGIFTGYKTVRISWDQTVNSGTRSRVRLRNAGGNTDVGSFNYYNGTGPKSVEISTTDGLSLWFYVESGNDINFDNISVVELDPDRSVNNNGLIVNGTITRSPVASGADLVAYSGFTSSNYLEQPYNSDLDFGTGDFCVMGWVTASASSDWFLDRKTSGSINTAGFELYQTGGDSSSGTLGIRTRDGVSSTSLDIGTITSELTHFVAVRSNGVMYGYINGVLTGSIANTRNVTNASANLFIGVQADLTSGYTNGSLALLRISATAPTAEQIAKIYEDEKVLSQKNAQATLYGSSDAVTALAHDDATNLLHVGTSDGRSVFQGLRRVENTTTAVGTAISASNGLVVEE